MDIHDVPLQSTMSFGGESYESTRVVDSTGGGESCLDNNIFHDSAFHQENSGLMYQAVVDPSVQQPTQSCSSLLSDFDDSSQLDRSFIPYEHNTGPEGMVPRSIERQEKEVAHSLAPKRTRRGTVNHTCATCSFSSGKAISLQEHAVETKHRAYVCNHPGCYKDFTQRTALSRHQSSTHSTVLRKICSGCGKIFNRKDHLTEHIKLKRCHPSMSGGVETSGSILYGNDIVPEKCAKTVR